jgi:DNA repair and recombination protein RAD52
MEQQQQNQVHNRQPLIPCRQQQNAITSNSSTIFGNKAWSDDEMARIQRALNQGLDMEDVAKRRGPGGTTLTYIEGWKAFEMANDIFGVDGWSCNIKNLSLDYPPEYSKSKDRWSVSATAVVTIKLKTGSYHEDVGCGNGTSRNKYDAIESAKKQAVTDARKRALRLLGPKLGNCLYDKKFKVTKRKALYNRDGINTKSNDGNHVNTFRPACNTAPPASYQSKMKKSITPANVNFKCYNNSNTYNNKEDNDTKNHKSNNKNNNYLAQNYDSNTTIKHQKQQGQQQQQDGTLQPANKKPRMLSAGKNHIETVNMNPSEPKTPVTSMKKNNIILTANKKHNQSNQMDDPFASGYDDNIYKSINLSELANKAKVLTSTKNASKTNLVNANKHEEDDPFAYDSKFDYTIVPDLSNGNKVRSKVQPTNDGAGSIGGNSIAY